MAVGTAVFVSRVTSGPPDRFLDQLNEHAGRSTNYRVLVGGSCLLNRLGSISRSICPESCSFCPVSHLTLISSRDEVSWILVLRQVDVFLWSAESRGLDHLDLSEERDQITQFAVPAAVI